MIVEVFFFFFKKNKLLDGKCLIKAVETDRNCSQNEKKTNGNSKTFRNVSNSKVSYIRYFNQTNEKNLKISVIIFV